MSQAPPVMIGLEMPDVDVWSERVVVALGQNPGLFTGPGTNTYLVGTGAERVLLDTGEGRPEYLPVLAQALERAGGVRIQEIVVSHGHPDHLGGAPSVIEEHGALRVSKCPWPAMDDRHALDLTPIGDGALVETEGATLRAVHTPGHAEDHLCFVLEEERAIFSGDNVLGVGTTVIPPEGGDLLDYMSSLERLLAEAPGSIYPAHGPKIEDGTGKIREYIAHRLEREAQIVEAVEAGLCEIAAIVKRVYAAYPAALHAPAAATVAAHLIKLEREGRVQRDGEAPLEARWTTA
ncbi:MAG: beta-lactamase-like protein 2 [Deltaproteobacteria bacterium]|nr:beta-lactamase-like protein 2 [Deltaproteobacteria bacterium]MBW2359909.1 beta-lactamase-like protein 2 [Deltaproteobacteria bacterium]